VRAGEVFIVERDGVTILHAVEPTELRVQDARSAKPRLSGWWKDIKQAAMHYVAAHPTSAARAPYRATNPRRYRRYRW
jgi:hypothetical protein